MRILHWAKTVDYAGTSKVAQILTAEMNKLGHEVYLAYRKSDSNNRLEYCQNWLGADKLLEHEWVPGKRGQKPPYIPEHETLSQIMRDLKPDIVNVHLSGYAEWAQKDLYPEAKWVLTNIFGRAGHYSDATIYISNFIRNMALKAGGKDGPIIFNPTYPFTLDKAVCEAHLKSRLGLPSDSVLLLRVGRSDNFTPLALNAMKIIECRYDNVYYLVVNPCEGWRRTTDRLNLKHVIFLPPVISDQELAALYGGCAIMAHCRVDGECQSVTINEAMMAGLPVVTHWADSYQGHIEVVHESKCGLFAERSDAEMYAAHLTKLIEDVKYRQELGENGRRWATSNVEATQVARQYLAFYESLLDGKV